MHFRLDLEAKWHEFEDIFKRFVRLDPYSSKALKSRLRHEDIVNHKIIQFESYIKPTNIVRKIADFYALITQTIFEIDLQ